VNAQNLDRPWHLLPETVKQWVRDNGYVIRENESGTAATTLSEWRTKYTNEDLLGYGYKR
jgi:hypothetical protein